MLPTYIIFEIYRDYRPARKAGIRKHISPHSFRPSFTIHLMEHCAHMWTVQEMLGHESIATTHLDREYLRLVIQEKPSAQLKHSQNIHQLPLYRNNLVVNPYKFGSGPNEFGARPNTFGPGPY